MRNLFIFLSWGSAHLFLFSYAWVHKYFLQIFLQTGLKVLPHAHFWVWFILPHYLCYQQLISDPVSPPVPSQISQLLFSTNNDIIILISIFLIINSVGQLFGYLMFPWELSIRMLWPSFYKVSFSLVCRSTLYNLVEIQT